MPQPTFQLEIMTPAKTVFVGPVASLVAPGALGYLGVLADHAPLLTTLTPGKVTYRDPSGNTVILASKGSGLLEVYRNRATLLVDDITE